MTETKFFNQTDTHGVKKVRTEAGWQQIIVDRHPVKAKETRRHKGSAPPFSRISNRPISDQAKALYYARHNVQKGQFDEYFYLIRFLSDQIERVANQENWRIQKIDPHLLADIALSPWVIRAYSEREAAKKCNMPRSTYQYAIAPRMIGLNKMIQGWNEELNSMMRLPV